MKSPLRFLRIAGICAAVGVVLGSLTTPSARAEVVFGSCPEGSVTPGTGVRCAVLTVPMDHARPDGPRIEITVSKIAATGERRGALFANPGGPGADALDFWASRGSVLPAELATHYDRFAVQPRGLRWSTPLTCGMSAADPDGEDTSLWEACESAHPGYPATITTEQTARDMDAVRAALGLDRIGYLGISYGTYLGAVYATLFPDHVDRMILDSTVHPNWVWTEQFARQQTAGKQRMGDLFTWIAEHDDTYHLGATPLQVYRTWVELVEKQGGGWYANLTPPPTGSGDLPGDLPEPLAGLVRKGVDGGVEQWGKLRNMMRVLTGGGRSENVPLLGATMVAIRTRAYWPAFATAMAEAHADPADISRLLAIEGVTGSDPSGRAVFSAVTCNENAIAARPDRLLSVFATLGSGGDAMDARADLVRVGIACSGWESRTRPVPIGGVGLRTPPLLLHSRHDPLTDYAGAPAMAQALGGSLITVQGGDHGTFGRGNATVDEPVLAYLETGRITAQTAQEAPIPRR
ncbi:alpha/beta hydrolase [Nocardia paucivorans]|uniref:alpha/beta hydrolase n=1 Tax=Nocardia paucivorans TaxID=114259 RepID=UPI0002DE6FC5|nr:alpha/beta hydrolase [Nocardia paucivorans]